MLRKKQMISVTSVLELFFTLFRCEDKILRKILYQYIITDIKSANFKHKDAKMNSVSEHIIFGYCTYHFNFIWNLV